MRELTKDEVGNFCSECTSGRFAAVNGYTSQTGEIANFSIQFGCYYNNLLKEDAAFLRGVVAGTYPDPVSVKHGIYLDGEFAPSSTGTAVSIDGAAPVMFDLESPRIKNRNAKGRAAHVLSYSLAGNNSMVIAAASALLKGIEFPKDTGALYHKEGKGIYSLDRSDGETHWYLRDGLIVGKTIIQEAEKKFSASLPETAIKNAVRKLLKSGRYRTFTLTEGNFSSVKLEGMELIYNNGKFFLN